MEKTHTKVSSIRDPTHADQIVRWADFMKKHPTKWRRIHAEFINSQYAMHDQFLERLKKMPRGREKIIKLYNIKNLKGYPKLLEE